MELLERPYAVVVQAVRENRATGKKVVYVLGVKIAKTKDVADKAADQLMTQGFLVDILPADLLGDIG